MIVATAMDLVLCAIDAGSGRARFGPKLSYALPVAELCDLVQGGSVRLDGDHLAVQPGATGDPAAALSELDQARGPLTVLDWVRLRGPYCIDRYLIAAVDAGVVQVVDQNGRKVLRVADAGPIDQVTRRLLTVLDDPEPGFADAAFVILADIARVARTHLHGRDNRKRRTRLSALRHAADSGGDGDAALRTGINAVVRLSRLAGTDPRTIDKQIGLTPDVKAAAAFLDGGAR